MQTFEYVRPADLSTAIALLAEKNGKARAMAGLCNHPDVVLPSGAS